MQWMQKCYEVKNLLRYYKLGLGLYHTRKMTTINAIYTYMFITPGLNLINALHTAFMLEEPKSVKKTSQVISLFTLLGYTSIKNESKYVGEIEPRYLFQQWSRDPKLN